MLQDEDSCMQQCSILSYYGVFIGLIEGVVVLPLLRVLSYAFRDGETVANAITLILNGIQPLLSDNYTLSNKI